jgi:hypothetical protein
MYSGTTVNWHDESELNTSTTVTESSSAPLFLVVSSFDKGPEDFREVTASNFGSLYGNKISFEKHGQNAIQAQNIANAGGKLFIKRVCAEDSTIANVILVANVSSSETQKVNSNGDKLYLDEAGEETTTESENPVMETSGVIKWTVSSVEGCKTAVEVQTKALELLDAENGVFPLFAISENGRGSSSKSIKITPDYNTSKGIGKMFYTATVFEGTTSTDTATISFDPEVIYMSKAYRLNKDSLDQLNGIVIESVYDQYLAKISEITDIDTDTIRNYDLVFGYTYKGGSISGITVDAESVDLNSTYGIELKSGSNGAFGDAPVDTEAWTEAIRKVFAGEVTDEIYDLDQHKIAAVVDANFPVVIKNAIADLVTFRKDCMFFRDYGTDNYDFNSILANYTTLNSEDNADRSNRFISDFCTSYEIKDPVTLKNIRVTMLYDFAACLVDHFNHPYNPLAGTANSFVLANAIKGTISYTPINTPSVNQKEAIEDIRVNYAIFEGDDCVVQSCYTCNDLNSQLSYSNNVLAIQEVIRAIRTQCPKNRFVLSSGFDFSNYSQAVSKVLSNYTSNFDTLEFEYTQNAVQASQKIFYATIKFAFNNWAQHEIFDVYAIVNE